MSTKQIEVHNYYKALHPKALILYRVPGQYLVMGEDVSYVQKYLPTLQIIDTDLGYMPDDVPVFATFGHNGTEVCIIDYSGSHEGDNLPNIELLNAEREMDY